MFYKMSILNILYTALVLNNGNIKYLSKMLPKVLKYKKWKWNDFIAKSKT